MEEKERCQIDRAALFCSGTQDYRVPPEPGEDEDVFVRFRTKKENADRVFYIEAKQEYEMRKTQNNLVGEATSKL